MKMPLYEMIRSGIYELIYAEIERNGPDVMPLQTVYAQFASAELQRDVIFPV